MSKKDVQDGKDEDLTQEPEMIKAFRDTWELGIHSYLTYLRNRLLLSKELLNETGSCFVQISDENIHHVREIMDEVFGSDNFCGLIPFVKTTGQTSKLIAPVCDYILWYSKNKNKVKYHTLFMDRPFDKESLSSGNYRWVELPDGQRRSLSSKELENPTSLPVGWKVFALSATSSQTRGKEAPEAFVFNGKEFRPEASRGWSTSMEGLKRLEKANRLHALSNTLRYVRFFDDFPLSPLRSLWVDTGISGFAADKVYVVQTNVKVIERCILLTTDSGDLVVDPTCGGGTTALCAEKWGRRWITCDTSRIAITLAKQRLMTAVFEYYKLAHSISGVSGGFIYKKIPQITLKSIANSIPPEMIEIFDQPEVDKAKVRITGPFTIEAVPAPFVKPIEEESKEFEADHSLSRSGETLRQDEWRSEIIKTGVRGKGGQLIEFSRIETLPAARWLHADAETKEADPKRVVISFGPDYAPLEQKQVERALEEASHLFPKPKMVIFAAFQFDPEAAKDIDEAILSGVTLLRVKMNDDLHTGDLKKKRSSNESFWLIGQPDIEIHKMENGKITVEVNGFDYYNPRTGTIESGGSNNIAMWMLDSDYDYRSLYPRQVFFPMVADDEGWSKLARNLKAQIDPELIEHYRGTVSLPFKPGSAVAVKIIDDRGIESLKIIRM